MLNGKKILSVCGAVALLLGVGMNLRHSLNDYGMGTNSLSTFALAQTSSSSGSGSSSSGSGWFWTLKETETECTYSKKECHNEKRHFLTPDLKIFHIPVRKPIDDQQCQWKSNSLFLSPKRTKKAPYR